VTLTPDEENRRKFERNPESEWVIVPVPDAGVPRESVMAARAALDAGYKPRAKARNEYELAGMLYCAECGLRLTGYSTGKDRCGRSYRYYCCQKRRKWGRDACPGGPQLRAQDAEREVCEWAEGLLEDPDAIARRMDEALASERASVSDPAAAERALAKRLSGLDAKRERLFLERAERELARVRRELAASPSGTDTVMAEVAT
jgi:Recombinase zinc beta ribbon domain